MEDEPADDIDYLEAIPDCKKMVPTGSGKKVSAQLYVSIKRQGYVDPTWEPAKHFPRYL